jgi:hypothetical protein
MEKFSLMVIGEDCVDSLWLIQDFMIATDLSSKLPEIVQLFDAGLSDADGETGPADGHSRSVGIRSFVCLLGDLPPNCDEENGSS